MLTYYIAITAATAVMFLYMAYQLHTYKKILMRLHFENRCLLSATAWLQYWNMLQVVDKLTEEDLAEHVKKFSSVFPQIAAALSQGGLVMKLKSGFSMPESKEIH